MAEDIVEEPVEEVTTEPAEATPPVEPSQRRLPPDKVAELLTEFADAGKQEPHELVKAVEKQANQIAQNLVRDLLDKREQTWQITQLAAKFIGGGKYGLPVSVVELTDFLESLDGDQFVVAKRLFETITQNGPVEFEEIGHGRRLRKQPLPVEYHDSLKRALAAGNTAGEFFELAGLGDAAQYDLSQFEGGK